MAEPEFGEWLANELVSMLEAMLAETELRAFRGEKIVEVKPVWANKSGALERLLKDVPNPDFIFAAGDDRTDEDLFERLSSDAWTDACRPWTHSCLLRREGFPSRAGRIGIVDGIPKRASRFLIASGSHVDADEFRY